LNNEQAAGNKVKIFVSCFVICYLLNEFDIPGNDYTIINLIYFPEKINRSSIYFRQHELLKD